MEVGVLSLLGTRPVVPRKARAIRHDKAAVSELFGASLLYMPADHVAELELSLLDPVQT